MSEQSRIRQRTPAEPQLRNSLEEGREIEVWREATWDSITHEMMAAFEDEPEQYNPENYHAAPAGELPHHTRAPHG